MSRADNADKPIYPPRLPGESPIAYAAFQLFLASGGSEQPEDLALSARAKPATLRKWYQKHQWLQRLQTLTATATEAALHQTRQSAEHAKVVRAMNLASSSSSMMSSVNF